MLLATYRLINGQMVIGRIQRINGVKYAVAVSEWYDAHCALVYEYYNLSFVSILKNPNKFCHYDDQIII